MEQKLNYASRKQEITTPLRFRLQGKPLHSCLTYWHFQSNQQLSTLDLRLQIAPEQLKQEEAWLLNCFGRVSERVSEQVSPVYAFRFNPDLLTPERIALFAHLEKDVLFIDVTPDEVLDLSHYDCLGLSLQEVSKMDSP